MFQTGEHSESINLSHFLAAKAQLNKRLFKGDLEGDLKVDL